MMNLELENLKDRIRILEHEGVECRALHHQFKFYSEGSEKYRALVEWAHVLGMMGMQSPRYSMDDDYREAVNHVLDLVREYVPAIITGRVMNFIRGGDDEEEEGKGQEASLPGQES